jgi:hypothetical protein
MNGDQLTLIHSFSENGVDVPGTVNIDLLQDTSTGALYVVSRGTANLQNAQSDLQLADDPVTQIAINNAESFLRQQPDFVGTPIEFVGHSLGGNLSLQLANGWINFEENPANGLTAAQIANAVSVHTYNPIGIPDMSPATEQNLAPVTTNFRLVVPDAQGALPNGMSAGDIVSAMVTLPGQTFEVAATPDTYQTFLDLHMVTLMAADWGNLTALPANAPGLGAAAIMQAFGTATPFFPASPTLGESGRSPIYPGFSAVRCRR